VILIPPCRRRIPAFAKLAADRGCRHTRLCYDLIRMAEPTYPRVASFRTADELAAHLKRLGWELPHDEAILSAPDSPLATTFQLPWHKGWRQVGNRFAVQPMEGWDAQPDGTPSDLTCRRWMRFARSGAKLIWGGEAVAVLPEARANPHQLLLDERTARALAECIRPVNPSSAVEVPA